MVRTVIVEDEQYSRKALKEMLTESFPDILIAGEAGSVVEAVDVIKKCAPDLVFLDIEMSDGNGFDLLEILPEINFEIIFTTAYDGYALKAIKFSALDYLLKPLSILELKKALEKVERKSKDQQKKLDVLLQNLKARDKGSRKIVLPTREGQIFMPIDDIIRCEASNNYTFFYLKDGSSLITSRTLKEYENLLEDFDFCRVHQSHLINMQCVKKYLRQDGGTIIMVDNTSIPLSQKKKEGFYQKLKAID